MTLSISVEYDTTKLYRQGCIEYDDENANKNTNANSNANEDAK